MGHDDADEADEPADRDHCCRAESRCHHDNKTDATHVGTQRVRFLVAHAEDIEQPSVHQQCTGADHNVGHDKPHVAPRGRGEPPENPRVHLAHHVTVSLKEKGLDCGGERRDGDTCQHQRGGTAVAAERRSHQVGHQHSSETTEERHQRQRIDRPGEAP